MDRYKVIKRAGRKNLIIRWHDGERWREQTAGTARRRDAERMAQQMTVGQVVRPSDDWLDFKQAFLADHHAGLSRSYRAVFRTAAKRLEELTGLDRVSQIDATLLATFRAGLREQGKATATIATYLRHLRKAIRWASEHGYLSTPVRVAIPRQSERMKGRPITTEEFERMLEIARAGNYGDGVDRLLECLWYSGLRISEALELSWDEPDQLLVVNIDGRRPLLEIPASRNKSRQPKLLALVPDFVAWLRASPEPKVGRVCRVTSRSGHPIRSADRAGRVISDIGQTAGVVTAHGHATAHDLRRSFAGRWAPRVPPVVLKELMRHADIKTTLTYYVGEDAERTADQVWEAVRRVGGDLGGNPAATETAESS